MRNSACKREPTRAVPDRRDSRKARHNGQFVTDPTDARIGPTGDSLGRERCREKRELISGIAQDENTVRTGKKKNGIIKTIINFISRARAIISRIFAGRSMIPSFAHPKN